MARRAAMPGVTGGVILGQLVFFFSSRRRHTRLQGDWSSDVCSSDLFTHLSFRGAPRREPAFKYLSFRIRFSGEESAVDTLLSHTCHCECASAGRYLIFARAPIRSRTL